jgi:hypothetical protein
MGAEKKKGESLDNSFASFNIFNARVDKGTL